MKIATWNVKGGAALPWFIDKKISTDFVDNIINEQADVFVITEIALASGWDYLEKRMKENEYVWFSSFVSGDNGILILVKRNSIKNIKELAKNLWWGREALQCYNNLGLMKVSFKMDDDKICTVCGFRMPTGDNDCRVQYDEMRKTLDKYVLPIAEECYLNSDIAIFAGDFNHARYLNNYDGKAQINYNWQILKSKFENIGYEMLDVDGHGEPIITKVKGRTGPASPIDHIFTKGFDKESCGVSQGNHCSDHLILWAKSREKA